MTDDRNPRIYYCYKGTSNFYDELILDENCENEKEVEKLHDEISKLKEENDKLKLELNLGKSSLRCGQCGNIGMFHNGIVMSDEITKLKKSREGLRKACEFYANRNNWSSLDFKSDCKDLITFSDLGVKSYSEKPDYAMSSGGRRAREALKADDKIMEKK